jgi:hypothetical protein
VNDLNRYFVSYNCTDGINTGFGHTETTCNFKIKGIEEIRVIAKDIEEKFGVENVIIISFKLFDE